MRLPRARGPLSRHLLTCLTRPVNRDAQLEHEATAAASRSPSMTTDEDAQLALMMLQELSHDGLDGVDDRWEMSPDVTAARAVLEDAVEAELRQAVALVVRRHRHVAIRDVATAIFELADSAEGPPLARYVQRHATMRQFEEFLVHRSVYALREADAHTWLIPRLTGRAKAALVEIQTDEYGGGRWERMHAQMFARTMEAAGLSAEYGYYLDRVPAATLAVSTTMRMFGQQRRLRGAAAGHLAAFEATSSIPSRRVAQGVRRLGLDETVAAYFDEHVEADAVHEQLAARDLCGRLVSQEPALLDDVLFGAAACLLLDARAAAVMLDAWDSGAGSLLTVPQTEPFGVAG
jgi:hypothetical protein